MAGAIIRNPTPDWLKPENASVFDSYWKQIARKVGHLIGADDPAAQVMTPLMTDASAAGTALSGAAQAVVDAAKDLPGAQRLATWIRAFHGSPHDFPPVEGAPLGRFDPTKIGTGEGAQAFSYGHYSAEQEGVAQGYKRALGNRVFKVGDRELVSPMGGSTRALDTQTRAENIAAQALDDAINAQSSSPAQFAANQLRQQAKYYPEENPHIQGALDVIHQWQKTGEVQKLGGHMYELNIKADPTHFLDWDKPLSQQSEVVRAKLEDTIRTTNPDLYARWKQSGALEQASAGALYRGLENSPTLPGEVSMNLGPKGASRRLQEAGIPGVKYLDAGSRATGEGTRNYVVFPGNEHLIDILRKYGVLPPVAGLGALSQVGQPEKR